MSEQATIVPPDPTDRIERRVPPNAAINGQSPPIHGMSEELFQAAPRGYLHDRCERARDPPTTKLP